MAYISGWVHVFIGVALSAAAYYLDKSRGTDQLTVFYYAGMMFVAWGLPKIVLRKFQQRRVNKKIEKVHGRMHKKVVHKNIGERCNYCRFPLRGVDRFCPNCGTKVI